MSLLGAEDDWGAGLRRTRARMRRPKPRAPLLRVLVRPKHQWLIDLLLDALQWGATLVWLAAWIPTLWHVFARAGGIAYGWGAIALSVTGHVLTLLYMLGTRQFVWVANSVLSLLCYSAIISLKIYEAAK